MTSTICLQCKSTLERRRLEAMAPQVEALPDPMASLALGNLPETAAGRVDAVVNVGQKIPFPGKRRESCLAAKREELAVRADAEAFALKLTEQDFRLIL